MTAIMQQLPRFTQLWPVGSFRKISAIILMAVYVPALAGFCELLKLPLLAEHFFDHNAGSKSSTITLYLIHHYVAEDGTDNDAAEDSRLPFKSAAPSAGISFTATVPPLPQRMERPLLLISSVKIFLKDTCLLSQYCNAVWQPPRFC